MSMLLSGAEVVALAKEIEKGGHAFYRAVADSTPDVGLRELFGLLAEEELRHYEYFSSLEGSAGELSVDRDEWEETSRYITATTEDRFFLGEGRAIAAAREARSVRQALDIAVGFEKDTLLYFYELVSVLPESSRSAARRIVDEEKRHVLMLSERRKAAGR